MKSYGTNSLPTAVMSCKANMKTHILVFSVMAMGSVGSGTCTFYPANRGSYFLPGQATHATNPYTHTYIYIHTVKRENQQDATNFVVYY